MDFVFKQLKDSHHLFFDMLPQDWQDEIVPYWDNYEASSNIYVLEESGQIIGGGIVFSTCPPDIDYYKKEAEAWFDKGFLYLGFIWIDDSKRNQNLGSFWLHQLKIMHPKQNYWLLIEDFKLSHFYLKNGFMLNKTIDHNNQEEWLYSYLSS